MGGSWVCEAFTFETFPPVEAGIVGVSVMVRRDQEADISLYCRELGTPAGTVPGCPMETMIGIP